MSAQIYQIIQYLSAHLSVHNVQHSAHPRTNHFLTNVAPQNHCDADLASVFISLFHFLLKINKMSYLVVLLE